MYWVWKVNYTILNMGLIENGAEVGFPQLSIPAEAVVPGSLGQGKGQGSSRHEMFAYPEVTIIIRTTAS